MFSVDTAITSVVEIAQAVPQTALLALVIFLISVAVGLLVVLLNETQATLAASAVNVVMAFFRGTPIIVMVFLAYFGIPAVLQQIGSSLGIDGVASLQPEPVTLLIIAISLTLSPFQAEIIRGAFRAVEPGQIAAADSLGYTPFQRLRHISIPQAVEEALPDLTNSFMVITKALSLGFLITVVDIFGKAQIVAATNFNYLEAFCIAALFYWALSSLIMKASDTLDKRFKLRTA